MSLSDKAPRHLSHQPGSIYPLVPTNGQEIQGSKAGARNVLQVFLAKLSLTAAEAATASTTGVHAAITAPSSGSTDVSTAITNPPYPRNITVTGNQSGVNSAITITGTNDCDQVITETITPSGTSTVQGLKAFKTVININVGVRNASGDTIAIGFGNKCGIPNLLSANTVLAAYFGGVEEGTAPTIVTDATNLESNTFLLNTTLNGTAVDLYYFMP